MRHLARFLLLALAVTLISGPVLAVPLTPPSRSILQSPAEGTGSPIATVLTWLAGGIVAFGITIRKDPASMAKKFVRNAGQAQGEYVEGVKNAGGEWEARTKEAEQAWQDGVQEAIGAKRFGKNVSGSAGRYQANAEKLGGQRYAPGVANAEGAWQAGTAPYIDVLKSLNLGPRGPRRSQLNAERQQMVTRALGAAKVNR